jgi:hypothetical protein
MRRQWVAAAVGMVLVCALTAGADTIYVNGSCGDDAWTGLSPDCVAPDGPKATIQAGIDASVDGDEVVIADGTYTGDGNRDLDFGGRAITVRSASGDPESCVIDCEGSDSDPHGGFTFDSGEGADSILAGMTIAKARGPYSPILIFECGPTIQNCRVTDTEGDGVFAYSATPTFANCVIARTRGTQYSGYGLRLSSSNATIADCVIVDTGGDGLYCQADSIVTATNCTIARSEQSGVYVTSSAAVTMVNCAIVGNGGVALSMFQGSGTLRNCTLRRRGSYAGGRVIYGSNDSSVALANCAVLGDIVLYDSTLDATYSAIEGGWPGEGNFDLDPLLTPGGYLTTNSPCIGAGDPDGDYTGQLDINGEPRALGAGVDIGADEWLDSDDDALPDWWEIEHFDNATAADPAADPDNDGRTNLDEYERSSNPLAGPQIVYVNGACGDDAWTGLSPDCVGPDGPKATIQAGIDACRPFESDEVLIADGVYTGDGNRDLSFDGKVITVRSASGDPESCVIDCEGSDDDEHRGFVFEMGEGPDSVLAGLTILNGYRVGNNPDGDGDAILCIDSAPLIRDCVMAIEHDLWADGVLCQGASPVFVRCVFSGWHHYAVKGSDGSDLTLIECDLSYNSAVAVYLSGSAASLTNCLVSENRGGSSGGIYAGSGSTFVLTNCTIYQNLATGGYLYGAGGGLVVTSSSSGTLRNCVVWGNRPAALRVEAGAAFEATYSSLEGGSGEPWFGVGCIDTDPLLEPGGHLTADSPGIDAGDPDGDYADQVDLDGEPRVVGDRVDMGVDEWVDSDADGLADWWETVWFGDPVAADPLGNPDGDSRDNRAEHDAGTDPFVAPRTYYVSADCGDDNWTGLSPDCVAPDGPKATIQAAVDACHPREGDEVVIADGTYAGDGNRDIDYAGRAITVRSASGDPESCVIDCEGDAYDPHRGFIFQYGEGPDSVLDGVKIVNGYVREFSTGLNNGGGLLCWPGDPIIRSCVVANCAVADRNGWGGGIAALESSPRIEDCEVRGCVVMASLDSSSPRGGGVMLWYGAPTLVGCRILENVIEDNAYSAGVRYGGGLSCELSDARIENCIIKHNEAERGGGVSLELGNPSLINCTIANNIAEGRLIAVGGVHCDADTALLLNCVIVDNIVRGRSLMSGGGVWADSGTTLLLAGSTIAGNAAPRAGGILSYTSAIVEIKNTIVWGNTAEAIVEGDAPVTATYSHIEGGWPGEGNIDSDPLLTRNGHVTAESPCINAGDPDGDYADQTDIDGEPRVLAGRVDIGADEWLDSDSDGLPDWWERTYFGDPTVADPLGDDDEDGRPNLVEYKRSTDPFVAPQTYFVDADGSDAWNGLCATWDGGVCGPKATIQAAINACDRFEGDQVVVADGTYTGDGNRDIRFGGRAITVRSASGNPVACVIDCQGTAQDPHHGFRFDGGERADSVLAGFTITNGYLDDGAGFWGNAGGIACNVGSPTVIHCRIVGNAGEDAGGVFCGGVTCARFIRCSIENNAAGGVYCDDRTGACFFNCAIVANDYGGLRCSQDAEPTLVNCLIAGNLDLGGVWCHSAAPQFVNCSIVDNTAGEHGGGVLCGSAAAPVLTNSVVWGNAPFQIEIDGVSEPAVSSSDVQGGWPGMGNVNADPLFVDPDGPDNDPATWADNDYRLGAGSPCIDAGDNDALPADAFDLDGDGDVTEPLPIDLGGLVRRYDDANTPDTGNPGTIGPPVVDMGAYEYALVGDLNGDGVVSAADIDPFVVALTAGPDAFAAQYPNGYYQNADCNGDGTVSAADIDPFVALLTR